jgi:hypothetical protein
MMNKTKTAAPIYRLALPFDFLAPTIIEPSRIGAAP